MAIRLRQVNGHKIALCAAETDAAPGDIYLDDGWHGALAAKFALDWAGQTVDWPHEDMEWPLMASQKLRDAQAELEKWIREREGDTDG